MSNQIIRTRDCVLYSKGDSTTVTVSPEMVSRGWAGGQGVQWVEGGVNREVTYSTGLFGGFLLWGSDEAGDKHNAQTRNQPYYSFATMFAGGMIMGTTTYEKYTYASRVSGPLVEIAYQEQDILYLSLRGLWTKEDELTLSGNSNAPCFFSGFVAQAPSELTKFFMTIQTSM